MYDRGTIMSKEEQEAILNFIYNKDFKCSSLSGNRLDFRFTIDTKNIPIELWKIKQRIMDKEGLREYSSTILDDFIAIIPPGGFIPRHIDKNGWDGHIHVRFNVFLKVAPNCQAYYADIPVEAKERHYVMCRSGIDFHTTSLNTDTFPRISLSYGFMLPFKKVDLIYKAPTYTPSVILLFIYSLFLNTYNYFVYMQFIKNPYKIYEPSVSFLDSLKNKGRSGS
jgi:hypothetical protein